FFGDAADSLPRLGEILMDVGAERLQRRHIDDPDFVRQRASQALLEQIVECGQKGGQRLPRTGRRGDESVPAFADRGPTLVLRRGWFAERLGKPAGDDRMKVIEGHEAVQLSLTSFVTATSATVVRRLRYAELVLSAAEEARCRKAR